jgi:murein DD-endopeptidase MepM/ murein hydrolase activator NlpD
MRNPFFPFLFNQPNQEQENTPALEQERMGGLLSNFIEPPKGLLAPAPGMQPSLRDHIDRLLAQTLHLGWSSPLRGEQQGKRGAGPQPPAQAEGGSPFHLPLAGRLSQASSLPLLPPSQAWPPRSRPEIEAGGRPPLPDQRQGERAPMRQLAALQRPQQPQAVQTPRAPQAQALGPTPLKLWPVPGHYELNKRDKTGEGAPGFMERMGNHHGIDIQAPSGTGVFAAGDGVVVRVDANDARGYGLQVIVDHGNGLFTQYAHLGTAGVKVGQKVITGMQIGEVGQSGNPPQGGDPHLHFEVRKWDSRAKSQGGHVVDPFGYLPDVSNRIVE